MSEELKGSIRGEAETVEELSAVLSPRTRLLFILKAFFLLRLTKALIQGGFFSSLDNEAKSVTKTCNHIIDSGAGFFHGSITELLYISVY